MKHYYLGCAIAVFAALPVHGQTQWISVQVATGSGKPTMALATGDIPHLVFLQEKSNGLISHAVWNPDTQVFDVDSVVTGYFYGPASIAIDPSDRPHISYHDHITGDQNHAFWNGQQWVIEQIVSSGHDGWDPSMVIGPTGVIHTASIDPVVGGIEYAYSISGPWTVESIGAPVFTYGTGTSIALDRLRIPHIAYHDPATRNLMVAARSSGWVITLADSAGDTGYFPSLAVDDSLRTHVAYFRDLGSGSGLIMYAVGDGKTWSYGTIDKLDHVLRGTASHMTSLVLDEAGRPHVSYGDQKVVRYAYRDDNGGWTKETVADYLATNTELGQETSLQLGSDGIPRVAYFEVNDRGSLDGNVIYAQRTEPSVLASDLDAPESPMAGEMSLDVYPNPAGRAITIGFTLAAPADATIDLYDVRGRLVEHLPDHRFAPGRQTAQIETDDLASGFYLVSLQLPDREVTRPLVVAR